MLRTLPHLLPFILVAVVGPLLIVMVTAFLTVPYVLGGHPGEVRAAGASNTVFHLS
jgi:hypothetical protein